MRILIIEDEARLAGIIARVLTQERFTVDVLPDGEDGLHAALTDAGYRGPVCIEVEDRAYEGSLADRKRSLRQSRKFLEQFFG